MSQLVHRAQKEYDKKHKLAKSYGYACPVRNSYEQKALKELNEAKEIASKYEWT